MHSAHYEWINATQCNTLQHIHVLLICMLLIYAANSTNSCRAYAASNADVHHMCAAANMADTRHMYAATRDMYAATRHMYAATRDMYAANMMNARVIYALLILLMCHSYANVSFIC